MSALKKVLPLFSYIYHPIFISIYGTLFYFLVSPSYEYIPLNKVYLILIQVAILTLLLPLSLYFLFVSHRPPYETFIPYEAFWVYFSLALLQFSIECSWSLFLLYTFPRQGFGIPGHKNGILFILADDFWSFDRELDYSSRFTCLRL